MKIENHRVDASDARLRNCTINEMLGRVATQQPDAAAILAFKQLPLTYQGLLDQINEVAAQLAAATITRNDRVAVALPNGPEMAVAFLAIASHATCAPLNPNYRASEFEFYLSDLQAKALIVPAQSDSVAIAVARSLGILVLELEPVLEVAGRFVLTPQPDRKIERASTTPPQPAPVAQDIALVLHTSGTTARPKIVPLTHQNLCASARQIATTLQLTVGDRCLNIMPLFHIHGLIGALLSTLASGGSIVCTEGFNVATFFQAFEEFCPSWYSAVPTMHQAILEQGDRYTTILNRHQLRLIRSSSASLPPSVMARLEALFQAPVIEAYGMTEATHQMASNPLPPAVRKPGSVGLAAGPAVAIMDAAGNLLTPGAIGEVVIRGENVTPGYANNPEANAKAFTNGWFRTGDQGYLDTDGYLFLNGRLKEIINRGGEKVTPQEVDNVLMELPEVQQAVTFAVPHTSLGEDIAAAVVLKPGSFLTQASIHRFLLERLAPFKVPSQVLLVDSIPKGPTGKLRRIGLAEQLAEQLKPDYVAPRNSQEVALAQIFSRVLGVEPVGVYDNFFSLGGSSIRVAQLFAEVEQQFHLTLPLTAIFEAPTVEQLAQHVTQRVSDTTARYPSPSLVPFREGSGQPPLFLIIAHSEDAELYLNLARYFTGSSLQDGSAERPIYGLRAFDAEGCPRPYTRISEIASYLVQEMRRIQPEGPYLLGGQCAGGVFAFEMALQLQQQQQQVRMLMLMDAAEPQAQKRPTLENSSPIILDSDSTQTLEKQRTYAQGFSSLYGDDSWSWQRFKMTLKLWLLRYYLDWQIPLPKTLQGFSSFELFKFASSHYASAEILNSPVTLYRATEGNGKPNDTPLVHIHTDSLLGWQQRVRDPIQVYNVPGGHGSLLHNPHVEVLARTLEATIQESFEERTRCF